jgi:hypothetical protein
MRGYRTVGQGVNSNPYTTLILVDVNSNTGSGRSSSEVVGALSAHSLRFELMGDANIRPSR